MRVGKGLQWTSGEAEAGGDAQEEDGGMAHARGIAEMTCG